MQGRWTRRIVIALVALLGLLFVAAGLLIATFDANRYKSLAVDWMKDNYQRTLTIEGPIELSVFPRLAVQLSKLRLSERGGADEFAALAEASLAVQVLPLLRKQLVIDRVSVRGVRAAYLRDAQGASNIDDLLARGGQIDTKTGARTSAGHDLGFDVSALELSDLQLRIDDRQRAIAGVLTVHRLTSGRLANRTESPLALQATLQLTQPQTLALTLDANTLLALDFDQGTASLGNVELDIKGAAAGIQDLALVVEARRAQLAPSAQRIEFDALKLALSGRQDKAPFEFALDWPRLAVDAQKLEASALKGGFKLSGPTTLEGDFSSGAPSGNIDALRIPDLTLTLNGHAGELPLEVRAAADLTLHGGKKSAAWRLTGAVNRNTFDSSGDAVLGARVPKVTATARFDTLDLNALTAPDKPAPGPAAPVDSPVVLDGLKAIDGRFDIQADTLIHRQVRVNDVALGATLNDGLLQIQRLTGRAWGGRIDASGSADASTQRLAVKLNANDVDVAALLRDVAGKDLLEGRGRVGADVRAGGTTIGALRNNLAGSVSLHVRDGAIKGINLAQALRQAKAALSGRTDAISKASATEKTDFSELSASARISDGIAVSDDLDIKSPFLRIGGAGRFDIGRGRIDYTARATVTDTSRGQGGKELAALRGVTVPVLLTGPFDAIDWKIQWSAVAAAAIEKKIKDKLAEKIGKELGVDQGQGETRVEDKLKEKLRGILK